MTNEDWREHPNYRVDPLQDIQSALLNSYDIKRYVDKGCLIEKSTFNENRLKPASYELRLLGELHYWNLESTGKLERRILPVCDKTSVIIPKNSITYLWIEEKFLLPEYIAARFNLHIRYVHKGILLGTGPLVDPGFFGRILISLHNLTNNDYTLKGGDGIIWVEFTKLNMNQFWLEKSEQRPQFLKEFQKLKDIKDPDQYFEKSIKIEDGVQSAFKGALDNATTSADEARNHADSIRKRLERIGYAAIVGTVLVIVTFLYQGYSFVGQIVDSVQEQNLRQIEFDRDRQSEEIATLKARVDLYEKEIDKLKEQIDLMATEKEAESDLVQ